MKKLLFTLFIFIAITSYGQSNFEKGFDDGWCQAHKEDKGDFIMCNRIAIPMAPMPQMFKDGYKDGFSLGYKTYSNKNSSGNSSGNQALIDGSKKMYEQSASKGLDLGLSYTPPQSSNNSQNRPPAEGPLSDYNKLKSERNFLFKQNEKNIKKKYKNYKYYDELKNLSKSERKELMKLELHQNMFNKNKAIQKDAERLQEKYNN